MSSATSSVWLGFTRLGGRFELKLDDLNGGIAMLGQGSNRRCDDLKGGIAMLGQGATTSPRWSPTRATKPG